MNQGLVNVVRALQGTPNRNTFFRVRHSEHPVRLDIELLLSPSRILALDDELRLVPDTIYVAFIHQVTLKHVILAPDDLLALKRFIGIEHGGQRIVINLDAGPRLAK